MACSWTLSCTSCELANNWFFDRYIHHNITRTCIWFVKYNPSWWNLMRCCFHITCLSKARADKLNTALVWCSKNILLDAWKVFMYWFLCSTLVFLASFLCAQLLEFCQQWPLHIFLLHHCFVGHCPSVWQNIFVRVKKLNSFFY